MGVVYHNEYVEVSGYPMGVEFSTMRVPGIKLRYSVDK